MTRYRLNLRSQQYTANPKAGCSHDASSGWRVDGVAPTVWNPDRDDRCVLGGASLLGPPERPAEECPTCLHSLTIGRRLRGSRVLREKLFCVSACGFRGREKMKKGGASCFPQNSKTISTHHHHLPPPISPPPLHSPPPH